MKLTTQQLKNYAIDCLGYGENDFDDYNYNDLKTFIFDIPNSKDACLIYNGLKQLADCPEL